MPELPPEIWSMIVKHVKRDLPPAGAPGNWNDHFHQQDLTSLMRVNHTLYQVVSEVLYHTPVVQDIGLFLLAFEKPKINFDTHHPDPGVPAPLAITIGSSLVQKRDLLGKVQKLYIIHHSSRTPGGSLYMVNRGNGRYEEKLEDCHADKLGSADLAGWTMARDLTSPRDNPKLRHTSRVAYCMAFSRLKTICFGTWDDGRWNIYHEQVLRYSTKDPGYHETGSELGFSERPTCPHLAFNNVLTRLFPQNRSYDSCYNARALVGLGRSFMSSRIVIHHAQLETDFPNDRIRIYASTSSLQKLSSGFFGCGGPPLTLR